MQIAERPEPPVKQPDMIRNFQKMNDQIDKAEKEMHLFTKKRESTDGQVQLQDSSEDDDDVEPVIKGRQQETKGDTKPKI